ncbi:DUF6544 family protein [Pontibacter sp. MBLB2868]|uniref:DUF6544 family protein n=1 Tax=Pontibacter sp. MBLB2868 TaxID=3451555 RepID=UPI003F74C330
MQLYKLFIQEIQSELQKGPALQGELSSDTLSALPDLMKNYLQKSGHINKPLALNCLIAYDHAEIKMKPDRDWLSMSCIQFNSSISPTRIALMKSKIFGLIPFSGKDKYQDGSGNMLIKMAGFTVTDAKGPQMNKAALVTYLSESVLLPSAILNNNISWQEVDTQTLKGTISNAGITVSGLFYFNEKHEIFRFETDDRYFSTNGVNYSCHKWSATLENYQEINGYSYPTVLAATWHLPEGDYTYFKGTIREIKYGITSTEEL